MVCFLTSVFVVLAHGQQVPAHVPVRFGMTMPEVYNAFGEPYEFPGRLRSSHLQGHMDWLGGEVCWCVYYGERDFRAVAWQRQYQPFRDPPEWLWRVLVSLHVRGTPLWDRPVWWDRFEDCFPETEGEAKPGWLMHPWQ